MIEIKSIAGKWKININKVKKSAGYPPAEIMNKGPVPIIECIEEIPCNPCETICNKNVIKVGNPITNLPRLLNPESCTGCGSCIAQCPGLAIFIVDKTFSNTEASISVPYELLPIPQKGEEILALNRNGEVICKGKIVKVRSNKKFNHTSIVTFTVPKEFTEEARFFKKGEDNEQYF